MENERRAELATVEPRANEIFARAFEDAPIGIALVSIASEDAGRPMIANRAFCELYGYSASELLEIDPASLSHPDDLAVGVDQTARMLNGEIDSYRVEKRFVRRNHEVFWARLHVSLMHDHIGTRRYVLTHVEDVTAKREAEVGMHRLATIVESSDDAICSVALDGTITSWNHGAELLFGYRQAEAIGRPIGIITPPELSDEPGLVVRVAAHHRVHHHETVRLTHDGRRIDVSLTASPLHDDTGTIIGASLVGRDISERKRMEDDLRRQAELDSLTGLFNRRRFEQALSDQITLARHPRQPCAVMLIDIDHFKCVNDSLGHTVGDDLLRAVAAVLRKRFRDSGLVARLGGDEFAVLLPGCTEAQAETLAQELLDRIPTDIRDVQITVSVGIAAIEPNLDVNADDILVAADSALYDAKEAGRNRVARFAGHPTVGFGWVQRIRRALAQQEFVLFAQPILDLRTDAVVAHELLVRMLDEQGQLLAPSVFMPVAERFDLIREIDRLVLTRALEIAARGHPININLSGRSAGDRDMLDWIANSVQASAIEPGLLTFEITETSAIANLCDADDLVNRLVTLGCGVALDDFGTGFGSFAYLKHLSVSLLKIDMEFIRTITNSPIDQSIVSSIVSVAGARGMQTVAEGVEDAATLELLREYGVDYAQGYHIAKPASAATVFARPRARYPGGTNGRIPQVKRNGRTSSRPARAA